jgi:hypothetical protein
MECVLTSCFGALVFRNHLWCHFVFVFCYFTVCQSTVLCQHLVPPICTNKLLASQYTLVFHTWMLYGTSKDTVRLNCLSLPCVQDFIQVVLLEKSSVHTWDAHCISGRCGKRGRVCELWWMRSMRVLASDPPPLHSVSTAEYINVPLTFLQSKMSCFVRVNTCLADWQVTQMSIYWTFIFEGLNKLKLQSKLMLEWDITS